MASLIYNSFANDLARGNIDIDVDTFRMMLVTDSYSANKDSHDRRNDITGEATGTGYTAGGATVAVTATLDATNDQLIITFAATSWPSTTITAMGAVVYKARGGAASADELLFFNDFGTNITRTNQTFAIGASTIYMRT
jgi:hypothetical protein